MKKRNARFWDWVNNGWVKITLKPGQSLSHHRHSKDEEGYSYEHTEWNYFVDGEDEITRNWISGGRDCDGEIRNTGGEVAVRGADGFALVSVAEIHMGQPMARLDWKTAVPTRVYDQYAQQMGY